MYIAEIAPAKIRGALVTLNQLAITFGIVAAYLADWAIAGCGEPHWQINYAWRWMFASECVPAGVLLVGLCFIPESPRWLLKAGYLDKAKHILTRVGGLSHAEKEIKEIQNALTTEEASIKQLFKPGLKRALFIGVFIMIFSQITGMNAIYMYTPKLLLAVGFQSKSSALLAMVIVGVVNFMTTIIAVCVIDKVGRRVLMLTAPLGMGLCMLMIAVGYGFQCVSPGFILAAILLFVFFFALGVGPGAWLVTSEIYPTKVRGRAMSICTFSLWVSSFVANLIFPKLLESSQVTTFGLFAGACFLMILFVYATVPETKGKTLEQIETLWKSD
ncbi:MAG: sugar porter family MFS transporter [Phycisphaeraceae bacterium]|nr:sugar porter family MFS transporter [Phycisphaeraceae bacterium]